MFPTALLRRLFPRRRGVLETSPAEKYRRPCFEYLEPRQMLSINADFSSLGTSFFNDQQDLYIPLTSGDTGGNVTYSVTNNSNANFSAQVLTGNPTIDINFSGNGFTNQDITIQLFANLTPNTATAIENLIKNNAYSTASFYRVITSLSGEGNFLLAQGGVGGAGTGSAINDEFNSAVTFNSPGIIGLARGTNNDTGNSEFFITDPAASYAVSQDTTLEQSLNFQYTAFGQLTSGFSAFQQMMTTAVQSNGGNPPEDSQPVTPITINSVKIVTDTQNAVLHIQNLTKAVGADNITISASDGVNPTQSEVLTVNQQTSTVTDPAFLGPVPATITTTENNATTLNLTATNQSNGTLTYTVTDPNNFGSTPANIQNISINQSTGAVTITPANGFTGRISLLAGVTSVASPTKRTQYDTQAFTMYVNAGTLSPSTLPDDTINTAYNQTITATDGVGNTTLTVSNILNPIPGLTVPTTGVVNSNQLVITGSPTATGTETFTVTATNASGGTTTANYTINVNPAVGLDTTQPPAGVINVAYNDTISASSGTGNKALVVSNQNNVIPGLTFTPGTNNLVIGGTPTGSGTETFTVTATDAAGGTATQNYSVTINAGTLAPTSLPADTINVAYNQTITATDTAGNTTLAISNEQNHIAGLVLTPGATGSNKFFVTGTPTATGTETFTITATDTGGGTTVGNYSITVNPAVTLTPATLPAGNQGAAYNQTITGANGTGAVTLVVSNIQNVVAGLTVDGSSGTAVNITGTPTASGTETFTVTATDAVGATTSTNYSITVNTPPAAPTGVAVSPGSGINGNYTTTDTPTLTVTAATGMTVDFIVGQSTIKATEGAAGTYTATIPTGVLALGTNSITATVTNGASVTSSPSTALSLTYAPSVQYFYTVPGAIGSTQALSITFSRAAAYNNELGYYVTSDASGTVNGLAPGAAGYAKAALTIATVVIPSGKTSGFTTTITVTGGETLGFYLVQNNSSANVLAKNPNNTMGGGPVAFFSFDAANPDNVRHVKTVGDPTTGVVQYSWEDGSFGGDRDYNDAVVNIKPTTITASAPAALRAPGATGGTAATQTFTLNSAKSVPGEFGIYYVGDDNGTVNGIAPGSAGYAAAALAAGNFQSVFTSTSAVGATKSVSVPAGQLFGFYTIVGGTSAQLLASNSGNSSTGSPVALFSFASADPNSQNHFRWYTPESISQGTPAVGATDKILLHIMDEVFGNDSNFDDLTVGISSS
jgi:cyclophilin family peptidyl-prolyl cis-trans isomerase